jgi:hypothetical protein
VRIAEDTSGLMLDAVAVSEAEGADGAASTLRTVLTDVRDFDVRVLEPARSGEPAQWRRDWPLERARPALISLTLGATAEPVTVSLAPLEAVRR